MKRITAVILTEEKGNADTQMILGRSSVEWVIEHLKEAGIYDVTLAFSPQNEELFAPLADKAKLTVIPKNDTYETGGDCILFIFGDMPLISKDTIKSFVRLHVEQDNVLTRESCSGAYIVNCEAQNQSVEAASFVAENTAELKRIRDKVDLSVAIGILRDRINHKHMQNGVTIIDPQSTYIDAYAKIDLGAVVFPNCHIRGSSTVGEYAQIGPDTILEDSHIGGNTAVLKSVVKKSRIGNDTTVGPYAYIRPDSDIGSHVKIGDFVEVKKSVIGDGTKVSHLTYVGDADVGKNIIFGCGTITVNYDGKSKHKTTIEDNAFIGCNTNLIAPVTVGKNAFVAAGSTINKAVPENALAIARRRQENKENWRKQRNGGE